MIIYHGRADPVFSINDSIQWYEKLNAKRTGKPALSSGCWRFPA